VIRIGGRNAKAQYQFTMQGADITALYDNAAKPRGGLRTVPIPQDVTTDLQIKEPAGAVRSTGTPPARSGVTVQQIEEALYDAYGSRQGSTIYTDNNQYWVIQRATAPVPTRPQRPAASSTSAPRRDPGPLTSVADRHAGARPLTYHSGPAPFGHAVVQPGAQRGLGPA